MRRLNRNHLTLWRRKNLRIRELLAVESIDLNAKAASKKEALDHAVDLMARSGKIGDVETYRKGVYAREEEGTTGIGEGIAIPHCKSDVVKAPGLAAMRVAGGVDFQSLDGEKADLIFLIAAPNTKDNVHLDVLSKLSVLLMDEKFTNDLRKQRAWKSFYMSLMWLRVQRMWKKPKRHRQRQRQRAAG